MSPLINWLISLACVRTNRVIIDVRGVYPTAIINNAAMTNARVIRTRDDFIMFVLENLD